jgi:hypothetical protein
MHIYNKFNFFIPYLKLFYIPDWRSQIATSNIRLSQRMIFVYRRFERLYFTLLVPLRCRGVLMPGKCLHHGQIMALFQQVCDSALQDRLCIYFSAWVELLKASLDVPGDIFPCHGTTPDADQ